MNSLRLVLWMVASPCWAAGPSPLQVQVWAASCMACHGTDGRAAGAGRAIAGQPAEVLLKSLQDYRDGRRPATVMHQHARGYSDAELALIAQHFARQATR